MTREEEVLQIIKKNPTIEQSEIADLLNITRSTVAVHIANLQKKGLLLGRAYIFNDANYVLGIGSCCIDLYAKSKIKLQEGLDHPSIINTCVGGVTRNVIENLSRLGLETKLITAIGEDLYGQMILNHCNLLNIDMTNSLSVANKNTSIFMQILDENNDMHMAMCDMSIIDELSLDYLTSKDGLIRQAKAIIIDPSLKEDVIKGFVDKYSSLPLFMDPISTEYAKKIKPYVGNLYCLKPNIKELEIISDIKINNHNDLIKAAKSLINLGLKKIYVSLGSKGCLYMDENVTIEKKLKTVKNMKNASGAGDAFMAAVVYGNVNNLSVEETLDYALAAGKATIQCEEANNPNLSIKLLKETLKGEE